MENFQNGSYYVKTKVHQKTAVLAKGSLSFHRKSSFHSFQTVFIPEIYRGCSSAVFHCYLCPPPLSHKSLGGAALTARKTTALFAQKHKTASIKSPALCYTTASLLNMFQGAVGNINFHYAHYRTCKSACKQFQKDPSTYLPYLCDLGNTCLKFWAKSVIVTLQL